MQADMNWSAVPALAAMLVPAAVAAAAKPGLVGVPQRQATADRVPAKGPPLEVGCPGQNVPQPPANSYPHGRRHVAGCGMLCMTSQGQREAAPARA